MGRNFIVIDTEGVSAIKHEDGQVHGETSLAYDMGWIVADREGNILCKRSFINTDVFSRHDLMKTAYYADKLITYYEGYGKEWTPADTLTIYQQFKQDCKNYNVRDVWAYNVRYDMASLNYTVRNASNGFVSWFSPYKTRYRDIWDYAGSTICNTKKYVKWCMENGFISPKENPFTNADTVGKYVTGDLTFEEQHTALSDCEIELKILLAALARHEKARHSKGQGWRDAAKIAKELK